METKCDKLSYITLFSKITIFNMVIWDFIIITLPFFNVQIMRASLGPLLAPVEVNECKWRQNSLCRVRRSYLLKHTTKIRKLFQLNTNEIRTYLDISSLIYRVRYIFVTFPVIIIYKSLLHPLPQLFCFNKVVIALTSFVNRW